MTGDEPNVPVVDGRFELEERLGAGGLATVWQATDRERDVAVALKRENEGEHDREQVRAHFRGELQWFRRFDGGPTPASLVQFVDGSADGDAAYVATELIRGGSVDAALEDGSVEAGLEAVREVGGPVCRALAFLHRNGAAHLDLKPSNVLVRRAGPPAVIDLNAAVATDSEADVRFRRDPFKSPELTLSAARDEPIGPRSDVYALGAFLAYLLTGTATAQSASSLAAWSPVDPRSDDTTCPPALAELLERATAPDHRDRFDDADDLYDALGPVLEVPKRSARLVHARSGQTVRVRPGDTLGRPAAEKRLPTVVCPDEERYLCPEHAVLEHDGTGWLLRDRSLNGTHIDTGDGWEYVLSRDGRERRRAADAPLPRSEPPASIRLADGDRVAPVSPAYGSQLVFRTES